MAQLIATSKLKAIIGTGITGLSVARFLAREQQPFIFFDTRETPPNTDIINSEFPGVRIKTGPLCEQTLLLADEIIVSPGLSVSDPAIQAAAAAGIPVVGDIALFLRSAKAPVVAITGSNAKSTVTSLVGEMAKAANIRVAVGGNLGTPALDLLDDAVELYVMELSSFQLETVTRVNARVATILNISEDHMDRYADMRAYHAAKLRIYTGAETLVFNRQDALTQPPLARDARPLTFGGPAEFRHFGVMEHEGAPWLAWQFQPLMPVAELKLAGGHNIDNALAALALGYAAGIPMDAMLSSLKSFTGLPHRCAWVTVKNRVDFYNDSKGTNVGATVAAIRGLARQPSSLVLIAGGDGKGAAFDDLVPAMRGVVSHAVLIGRDAERMAAVLQPVVPVHFARDMDDAVQQAYALALPGDAVLLSPACASLDMFRDYAQRGEIFCRAAEALVE